MLAPWAETGLDRVSSHSIFTQNETFFDNSRGGCQNPLSVKILSNGKMYLKFSRHIKINYDFMNRRKLYAARFFASYHEKCSKQTEVCPEFDALVCFNDMSFESTKGLAFGYIWGGVNSGTLPLPVGEWNMPATLEESSYDLVNKTRRWRENYPWEERESKAVFRGAASGEKCVREIDGLGNYVPKIPENEVR